MTKGKRKIKGFGTRIRNVVTQAAESESNELVIPFNFVKNPNLKDNNEMVHLEGFFYYPSNKEGLEELTERQRFELLENQGNYMVGMMIADPDSRLDLICSCDNGLIPTHRSPGKVIPGYGDVPVSFRQ